MRLATCQDSICTPPEAVTIQVDVTGGAPTGSLGNELRAVRNPTVGDDIDLSWPTGVLSVATTRARSCVRHSAMASAAY